LKLRREVVEELWLGVCLRTAKRGVLLNKIIYLVLGGGEERTFVQQKDD
jgi:hypothetical protein